MKKVLFFSSLLLTCLSAQAFEKKITSPDGNLVVTVNDEGGKPGYQVDYKGTAMLLRSPLGLVLNFEDLTKDLVIKDRSTQTVTDDYSLKTIKQSNVHYEATEAVCQVEKNGRHAMDIIFRVSNRDVAFSYKLYSRKSRGGETLVAIVENEASGFVLPDGTTTFLCPQSKPMGGFARTSPSYETSYTLDEPMGKNGWGEGYSFPCLFKVPVAATKSQPTGQGWVLISETGTDGNYVACRLLNEGGANYKIGFPQQGEMNGWGTTTASVSLPAQTPWRTITVGNTLQNVVETTVPFDLVKPKYKASRDYTYGAGSWSWIIGMDSSCNFDEQKRYIDFSAAMGWRSVLIDALWDKQIGYEKMAELSRYAKSKGVGLFLWYNSNGSWNDAPQSPLNKMNRSAARRQEMKWMQENGILGIKVDFFGGDKQAMMQLYEDILTDANEFGIQCIFHGCTLPRGWERMYPNFVACEAVRASENLSFGQHDNDIEALAATIHPVLRNAVGNMDFGGSALNKYYSKNNQRGNHRVTSDVYALATAILFQTPVQNFALAPNNLTDAPAWAIDFMKAVPTTWKDINYIDGYPGKFIVMARQATNGNWYVAGVNANKEPLTVTIPLKMFSAGQSVKLYLNNGVTTTTVSKKQTITVTIPSNGGVVIC